MFNLINNAILAVTDPVFNWLLFLPTDVILFIVAIGTSLILVLSRTFTTNQDLLKRADKDKKRLKELGKEAKQVRDKEAFKRYKMTKNMIALKTLKQEGLPLLVALIPIALLGTWCFSRISHHPPKEEQVVEVTAYFPISAAGGITHIIPQEDVAAENGWIQEIEAITEPAAGPPYGKAKWLIKAQSRPEPYDLAIRYKKSTFHKGLQVGQRTYEPVVEFYDSDQITCVETLLEEVKLFGIVPGIPLILLAPWIMAYLAIAVPFVFICKWVLKIY